MFQSSGSSLHSAPTSGVELQRRKIKPPETLRSFQDLLTPSPPGGATPSAAGARREEELNSSGEQDGSDEDSFVAKSEKDEIEICVNGEEKVESG